MPPKISSQQIPSSGHIFNHSEITSHDLQIFMYTFVLKCIIKPQIQKIYLKTFLNDETYIREGEKTRSVFKKD